MEFSKATIAALELSAGKADAIYFDDDLPGFGIRLRSGGKRVWIVQYRVAGRQRRSTLGDCRKIDLATARAEGKRRLAQASLGSDPQADKAAAKARAAVLLGPLVDRYLALKQPKVRKNTYVADKRYLTSYFKPLRGLPVDDATRKQVAARLNDILLEHGATAAARARQSLSAFFSWAIREGLVEANPVMGTNDPGSGLASRDRVLTDDELRAVWSARREDDFGRIIGLLMLTACRRDEIGGIEWNELDLDTAALSIPGTRTKNHHPHRLTLPAQAVAILRSAPQREGRRHVFGLRGGAFSRWSWEKLAMDKRIAEAGIKVAPWRLHDIRRTVATGMAELGVQPHIIEAILNHRGGHKGGVAGIYNRATYEAEIKRALVVWAEHLMAIVDSRSAQVTPFRRAV